MSDVLVHVLHRDGAFHPSSLGAVSEGSRVARELGGSCHAIVVGDDRQLTDAVCGELGRHGAARVFRAAGQEGVAHPIVEAMAAVIDRHRHSHVLFGGGLVGLEAGAALAARLQAGICVEATSLEVREGELIAQRPILGESRLSSVRFRSRVGVVVGRLNAFRGDPDAGNPAPVDDVPVVEPAVASQVTVIERGRRVRREVDVEEADIVVTGGRGLGRPEGFAQLEELAEVLGGAVGATRAVVDAGWYPYAAQVGQTGKTVTPRLYVAAGVSGAIQHRVGMQNSEHILAINSDRDAPIFDLAHLGVVGDLNRIVPRLTEALRRRQGG